MIFGKCLNNIYSHVVIKNGILCFVLQCVLFAITIEMIEISKLSKYFDFLIETLVCYKKVVNI